MLNIPPTLPVRTRVPLAGWAVAAVVTVYAVLSSLLHGPVSPDQHMPQAEQSIQKPPSHQAKV